MAKSLTAVELRRFLPNRKPDAHKGHFGHVLIVAGSRGMSGAAALAGRAALRAGAGLVTIATPSSMQPVVAGLAAESLTLPLAENNAGGLAPEACAQLQAAHVERAFTVMGIGPGLGTNSDTARAVIAILAGMKLPTVVDADALNNLAGQPPSAVRELLGRRGAPCVFTPHPGEIARLLRAKTSEVQDDRAGAAQRLAESLGVVRLLKGKETVIADGHRVAVNPTGNPGLAKGGTGDVLTGVIAALWAQRLRNEKFETGRGFEAAMLGAYLHGLAADIAVKEKTVYSLLASDVIEALPLAFKKFA